MLSVITQDIHKLKYKKRMLDSYADESSILSCLFYTEIKVIFPLLNTTVLVIDIMTNNKINQKSLRRKVRIEL